MDIVAFGHFNVDCEHAFVVNSAYCSHLLEIEFVGAEEFSIGTSVNGLAAFSTERDTIRCLALLACSFIELCADECCHFIHIARREAFDSGLEAVHGERLVVACEVLIEWHLEVGAVILAFYRPCVDVERDVKVAVGQVESALEELHRLAVGAFTPFGDSSAERSGCVGSLFVRQIACFVAVLEDLDGAGEALCGLFSRDVGAVEDFLGSGDSVGSLGISLDRLLGYSHCVEQLNDVARSLGSLDALFSSQAHLALGNLNIVDAGQSLEVGEAEVVALVPVVAVLAERAIGVAADDADCSGAIGDQELDGAFSEGALRGACYRTGMLAIGEEIDARLVGIALAGIVGHEDFQLILTVGQASDSLCDGVTLPPRVEEVLPVATVGGVRAIAVRLNASV